MRRALLLLVLGVLLVTACEEETPADTVSPAAYKASCRSIQFRVLDKKPDFYTGYDFYFRGQVVQIIEDEEGTTIRLAVTKTDYGWQDPIMVFYEGSAPIYKDDVITVWGECIGAYSYESTIGAEVTVPGVLAYFVERTG